MNLQGAWCRTTELGTHTASANPLGVPELGGRDHHAGLAASAAVKAAFSLMFPLTSSVGAQTGASLQVTRAGAGQG
jgi:hypothetical protein